MRKIYSFIGEDMTKFCTNCGNKLEENSSFCTNCGTKIDSNVEPKKKYIRNN